MQKNQTKYSGSEQDNLIMTLQLTLKYREAEVLLDFHQDPWDRGEEDQGLKTVATDPLEEEERQLNLWEFCWFKKGSSCGEVVQGEVALSSMLLDLLDNIQST